MEANLNLKELTSAVEGAAAAFRSVTILQPVGGEGDKVFPATYSGGKYATETRRILLRDEASGKDIEKEVHCVLINSVQSEANHAEEALRQAILQGDISIPLIEVDFSGINDQLRKPLPKLSSLEVPHRLADAILRDSLLPDGTRFSKSEHATSWARANLWNATPIYERCPTALLFGMWGSPEKPGGLGAKFERAYVSEIVGVDVLEVDGRSGFRIDPIETSRQVPVKRIRDGFEVVTANTKGALRPSELNHGNIPFDSANGGLRFRYAEQTTVISLGSLRKLRFPVNGIESPKLNSTGRTVLAALGLCAGVLAAERGTSLRSRCHLWPTAARGWELLEKPGNPPRKFQLSSGDAVALLKEAVSAAESAGLAWMSKKLTLTPSPELSDLIRQSQEVMAKEPGEGEAV